jgi:hypothetical protein
MKAIEFGKSCAEGYKEVLGGCGWLSDIMRIAIRALSYRIYCMQLMELK